MRKIGAVILALTLIAPNAFAAQASAPLAPGKPAGVQQAQALHSLALWVAGVGVVAGGILLATSGNNKNTITTTVTTRATSTTGTP